MLYKFNKKQGVKYEHDVNMCNVIVFVNFLPISNPTTFINKKGTTTRAVLILLVRMTGFEPTRISSLEPETSASAVPPHPQNIIMQNAKCIMQNYLVDVLHIDDKILMSSTMSFSILLNSCSVRKSVLYKSLIQ